jgi:hypothetical protein
MHGIDECNVRCDYLVSGETKRFMLILHRMFRLVRADCYAMPSSRATITNVYGYEGTTSLRCFHVQLILMLIFLLGSDKSRKESNQ